MGLKSVTAGKARRQWIENLLLGFRVKWSNKSSIRVDWKIAGFWKPCRRRRLSEGLEERFLTALP